MVLASLLALVASSPAGPEELKSKLGFFVDMPSGFTLKSGDGATRFAFTDPKGVMEYDIIAYAPGRFADASALAGQSLGKIGSSGNTTPYTYEGREAVLAELGFDQDGVGQKGYALFIQGRDGGAVKEDSYALLAYAPEPRFEAYSDFILSCLDCFSVDAAARRSPGPLSQFTLDWPPKRDKQKTVAVIGGASVSLPWSDDEAAQESQTDQREYKVLTAYANEATLWQDAWARYYRMAYRESAARLDRLSLEMTRTRPARRRHRDRQAGTCLGAGLQLRARQGRGKRLHASARRGLRGDRRLRFAGRRRRHHPRAARHRLDTHGLAGVFARDARRGRIRGRPALRLQREELPGRRDYDQDRDRHDSREHGRLEQMDGHRPGALKPR